MSPSILTNSALSQPIILALTLAPSNNNGVIGGNITDDIITSSSFIRNTSLSSTLPNRKLSSYTILSPSPTLLSSSISSSSSFSTNSPATNTIATVTESKSATLSSNFNKTNTPSALPISITLSAASNNEYSHLFDGIRICASLISNNRLSGIIYYGSLYPYILLITGDTINIDIVRNKWTKKVLRSPDQWIILKLDDVSITTCKVAQCSFTPLWEAIICVLITLDDMNLQGTVNNIMNKIDAMFGNIVKPTKHMIRTTLNYMISKGYIVQDTKGVFKLNGNNYQQHLSSPSTVLYSNNLLAIKENKGDNITDTNFSHQIESSNPIFQSAYISPLSSHSPSTSSPFTNESDIYECVGESEYFPSSGTISSIEKESIEKNSKNKILARDSIRESYEWDSGIYDGLKENDKNKRLVRSKSLRLEKNRKDDLKKPSMLSKFFSRLQSKSLPKPITHNRQTQTVVRKRKSRVLSSEYSRDCVSYNPCVQHSQQKKPTSYNHCVQCLNNKCEYVDYINNYSKSTSSSNSKSDDGQKVCSSCSQCVIQSISPESKDFEWDPNCKTCLALDLYEYQASLRQNTWDSKFNKQLLYQYDDSKEMLTNYNDPYSMDEMYDSIRKNYHNDSGVFPSFRKNNIKKDDDICYDELESAYESLQLNSISGENEPNKTYTSSSPSNQLLNSNIKESCEQENKDLNYNIENEADSSENSDTKIANKENGQSLSIGNCLDLKISLSPPTTVSSISNLQINRSTTKKEVNDSKNNDNDLNLNGCKTELKIKINNEIKSNINRLRNDVNGNKLRAQPKDCNDAAKLIMSNCYDGDNNNPKDNLSSIDSIVSIRERVAKAKAAFFNEAHTISTYK